MGLRPDDRLLQELTIKLEAVRIDSSPFSHEDLDVIPKDARWCPPGKVVEVRFTQWTREGRLRNPVFLGFRPDKSPAEVVREEA